LVSIGTTMSKADTKPKAVKNEAQKRYYRKNRESILAQNRATKTKRRRATVKTPLRQCLAAYKANQRAKRKYALTNNRRDKVSTTLETWSTQEVVSIGFDRAGAPIDLNRIELGMLIEALQDLQTLELSEDVSEIETHYKEYAIKEDV